MAITLKRLEELAEEVKTKASNEGFDVEKETVADDESYYMGRYEALLSLIEEADEDGAGKLYNKYANKGNGH